jgi:hypothetical protein
VSTVIARRAIPPAREAANRVTIDALSVAVNELSGAVGTVPARAVRVGELVDAGILQYTADGFVAAASDLTAEGFSGDFADLTNKPTTLAGYGIIDAVPAIRNLIAGNGMTGGGTLAADRTFTLGTPGSLTNATTNAVTATSHTHDVTLSYLFNTDDRSAPLRQVPADYTDRGLSVGFNSGANLGTPGSYGMSLHLAPWSVYNAGYKQHQLNFAGDGSAFYWRTATSDTTWGPAYKVHTDASTDINAATVAGLSATAASTGNTIVARNGSGDIFARLFRSEYASTGGAINYFATQVAVGVGADNYLRPSTTAQVAAALLADGQIGYRNVPLTTKNATYTLVADDAGKGLLHSNASNYTYTIPAVFAGGDVITIVSSSSGILTLTGSGVDLYPAPGTGAAGNRTLGTRAVATVFFLTATTALVYGIGVS